MNDESPAAHDGHDHSHAFSFVDAEAHEHPHDEAAAAAIDEAVQADVDAAERDIAAVPAAELIMTVSVHLMSAAAVKLGLGDAPDAAEELDLDEARKLIDALAGLVAGGAVGLGDVHARPIRDGLRSLQLAFREASPIPDPPGKAPGEKYTGSVI